MLEFFNKKHSTAPSTLKQRHGGLERERPSDWPKTHPGFQSRSSWERSKQTLRELCANAGCECEPTFICMFSRRICAMDSVQG